MWTQPTPPHPGGASFALLPEIWAKRPAVWHAELAVRYREGHSLMENLLSSQAWDKTFLRKAPHRETDFGYSLSAFTAAIPKPVLKVDARPINV